MLDSGCTQHMIGDPRMFNSINENKSNGIDSITFGDNGKGKIKMANKFVSSIMFDSCYLLTKGVNGVSAKFVGTPTVGSKKKAI